MKRIIVLFVGVLFVATVAVGVNGRIIRAPSSTGVKMTVESGSEIEVQSGGTVDVQSGATFGVSSGTVATLTSTAITATTISGTSDRVTFPDTTNVTGPFQIDSTEITATAAELNYNDVTTLGTSQNSKVATYSATGEHTVASGDTTTYASGSVLNIDSGSFFNYAYAGIATMGQGLDGLDTIGVTGLVATDVVLATCADTLADIRAWSATDTAFFSFGFVGPLDVNYVIIRP